MRNITITGPRSVGKSTISKLLSKKLKLKYISSDELGEKLSKNFGGLDKAIKSGKIKELIRKKGYTEILKQYKKKNFIFDLSVGSYTSSDFKRASRQLRSVARKNSFVIGLLPSKKSGESIDFLYKREAKRSHFKNVDKEQLLERTKRRYPQQRDILLKNADKIIYVKDLKQRDLGAMIIRVVSSDNTTPVRLS
jgi:adenylate kinase family enzyme